MISEIDMGAQLQNIGDRLGRAPNEFEAGTIHMGCAAGKL